MFNYKSQTYVLLKIIILLYFCFMLISAVTRTVHHHGTLTLQLTVAVAYRPGGTNLYVSHRIWASLKCIRNIINHDFRTRETSGDRIFLKIIRHDNGCRILRKKIKTFFALYVCKHFMTRANV